MNDEKKDTSTGNKEIGARLRALRDAKKQSQKDVSEILGVTQAAYGKFEAGDRDLSTKYCIKLADYFGVTCDYILRGVDAPYVDMCRVTDLTQESINALKSYKQDWKTTVQAFIRQKPVHYEAVEKLKEISLKTGYPVRRNADNETLEIINEIDSENDLYFKLQEKTRVDVYKTIVLNSVIQDDSFLTNIAKAAFRAGSAYRREQRQSHTALEEIEISNTTCDDQIFSARYVAGQLFGQFFVALYEKYFATVSNIAFYREMKLRETEGSDHAEKE